MTVGTPLNKIIYPGNASATSFPFAFATPGADISVFFTDALGNVTLLVQGPGSSQYQIVFNPPIAPNPTPIGGTVTYNPGGTPIPLGTFLTILRSLPLIQQASFANQGTIYPTTVEQAFDYSTMLAQQILEVQSRALVVNVSDPTPNPLPAAASRANLILGFDSNGNPIAVSTLPAGTVSSAMAPVVNAASLATARSLLGLGNVAVENIGLGLQDNGAGSLQTFYKETTDSVGQSVTSAFHTQVRSASVGITYTLPQSSTLFNGFGFWVYAQTAAVTFAINAGDMFSGGATGQSLVIPPGSRVFVSTDAAGNWYVRGYSPDAFGPPKNVSFSVSEAAGAMTITLLDANGNAPSPASPVLFTVPNGSGGVVPRAVTTPLTITVPSGATLGTVSNVASRIWVHLFDNAGTPILGVYNTLTNSNPNFSLLPWDQTSAQTTTAISAGSTSAQVHYTSSGLTSKFFTPLGYIESTQTTAGTWAAAPSKTQLFGPGVRRPGDVVNRSENYVTSDPAVTSATFVVFSGTTFTLNLSAQANLVRVRSEGMYNVNAGSAQALRLSRGNTNNTNLIGTTAGGACNTTWDWPYIVTVLDLPNNTSAQYSLQGLATAGATVTLGSNGTLTGQPISMELEEIFI